MINAERLRGFSPLNILSPAGLRKAAEAIKLRDLMPGDILFQAGDRDSQVYFLLKGSITLRREASSAPIIIRADTEAAQVPLSRLKPRRYTAAAGTIARVAGIDEDLLDNLITTDQTAAYEVTVIEGEDPEWMFRLFSSPSFRKVPTDNLAALFSKLEAVPARAGETIIRQGETGDYYYLIRRGRARVLRSYRDEAPVFEAELGIGDGFGEEALLSGEPRNATVVMSQDGLLMRLSHADFNSLLKAPLVQRVSPAEMAVMLRNGVGLIDVRTEPEFNEAALPGSINLPLCKLRLLAEGLDHNRPYIAVCQTGRRCSAAAFLLGQRGFDVYVLRGGLNAIRAPAG